MTILKQVTMTLHRLATEDSHYSVIEMFGVAACTSVKTSKKFVKFFLIAAIPLHLKWSTDEELENVKLGFHDIVQCCGAIDCTHILFDKPLNINSIDWFDRDHNYSMILQAMVDSKTKFINIFAEFPGSIHNSRVFSRSNHQLFITIDEKLNVATMDIQGVDIHEFIIGDAGYTASRNMFVPRSGQQLSPMFKSYNFKHSSTRMCVERAFCILKGVWRILKKPMTHVHLQNIPLLVVACCILHNIIIDRIDIIDEDLVLWDHHNEEYTESVNGTATEDKVGQLQLVIAKHMYLLEATCFNE
jgi:hypothetical protein